MAGFHLAQKGSAGDKINMRWTMTTMTMAREGSKGKVLMIHSVLEHKCILTNNIIYWVAVKIGIKFKPRLFRLYLDRI